jgi:uncharacterized UPF0160 family protein
MNFLNFRNLNWFSKIPFFNFKNRNNRNSHIFNLYYFPLLMEAFTSNKDRIIITTEDMDVFVKHLNENLTKKCLATHSGAFHADEVLATTMLKFSTEFKDSWIVRSRNYEIHKKADLVCDVGGIFDPATHRYDHHMKEFTHVFDDKMKIKMSSAGLVYKYIGMNILENILKSWNLYEENKENMQKIYDKVYENFIAYVDGADNGINQYPDDIKSKYANTTTFGARINRTNPEWNEEKPDQSANFKIAQDIAEDEFLCQVRYVVKGFIPAYSIVKDAIQNRFKHHDSGKIIVLEKSCPWRELLFVIEEELGIKDEIIFAIYSSHEKDFRVQTVPINLGNFRFRKGLHEDWRGLEKEKLAEISGIEDINFCHTSGFIGGARSFESAMKMADISLKQN